MISMCVSLTSLPVQRASRDARADRGGGLPHVPVYSDLDPYTAALEESGQEHHVVTDQR